MHIIPPFPTIFTYRLSTIGATKFRVLTVFSFLRCSCSTTIPKTHVTINTSLKNLNLLISASLDLSFLSINLVDSCCWIRLVLNTIAMIIQTEEAFIAVAREECILTNPTWPWFILIGPFLFNCIIYQLQPKIHLKPCSSIIPAWVFFQLDSFDEE